MYEYDKVKGGLFGLLIGDALGVPYEFYEKEYIPSKNLIEFEPPSGFKKTYEDVKSGTWSDDGAQALCLFESLIKNNRLDMNDFSNELIQWYDHGKWAVDNYVFDVGMQTENALILCKKGISPLKSGFVNPEGKGNGSLMRVLPLVLWHKGSDYELVLDAHKQSLVTHGHICNQVCCAFYCVTGREILKGRDFNKAYRNAVIKMRNLYKDMKIYETEFESVIKPDEEMSGKGTGYVVD
uniref:ADP-ribosylglycohydrolase family protein n=1 Tax=uncultured Clostridium sp. TaxID=59620 RepID=UPI0025DCE1D6